jgi:hypothetical protein
MSINQKMLKLKKTTDLIISKESFASTIFDLRDKFIIDDKL